MRKIYFTSVAVLFLTTIFGQKTELKIAFNSGSFSFSGASAQNTSFINYSTFNSYTNNPYGSKAGLCYGLSGNLKRVSKTKIVYGVDLGYEVLRSKVLINGISGNTAPASHDANGKTFLNYHFINLFPNIGYRLYAKKLSFDLTGGLEVGFCLNTKEKGNATASDGIKYTTSVDRKTINTDARPRVQLSANYNKAGVYIGYSLGLANYRSGYVGGTNECYARMFRFGVTYQVK